MDFSDGVAVGLIGVVGVLIRLGHLHKAAHLLGVAEAIQAALGMGITAADELDYRRTRMELQAQLGEADFDCYWQAGRRLTMAEVMASVHEFS